MKNADMPAMPTEDIQGAERKGADPFGNYTHTKHKSHGLTKREMFAMHALSHVLDKYNPYENGDFDSSDYEETAKHAVGLADAILKELEK